ncbi:MAG: hypothetical protein ACTSX9_00490 [Candidatus Njordarchaeales archaeon]
MSKDSPEAPSETAEIWENMRQRLEEVTKEYQKIKSEISDIDTFLKEVVNQLIIILQDIHESLDMLENKANEIEQRLSRQTSASLQIQPITQPASSPTKASVAPEQSATTVAPQQSSQSPPAPTQQTVPQYPVTQQTASEQSLQLTSAGPSAQPSPQQSATPRFASKMSARQELMSQLKQVLEKRRRRQQLLQQ